MPSWKKIIASGSDASFSSATVDTYVSASSFKGSFTGSLFGTSSQAVTSSYAQTSSFANNFTVANTLTAQTLIVSTISSSVEYSSGSNVFGNSLSNTQTMTGSVNITGSLNLNNNPVIASNQTGSMSVLSSSYALTASYVANASSFPYTGSAIISGSLYTYGNVTHDGVISGSQPTNNPSSSLILISGSILPNSGSTSGASAMYVNTVMSASANNQTLVGLDINPTFNAGAFTGLSRLAARFTGNVLMGQIPPSLVAYSYVPLTLSNNAVGSLRTQLSLVNGGGSANAGSAIDFFTYTDAGNGNPGLRIAGLDDGNFSGNFQIITKAQGGAGAGALSTKLQLFGGTGNLILQNGGTFTDNGYRLQVNGSGSLSGSLFVSGSSSFSGSLNVSQGITGSLFGTSSYALTASYLAGYVSPFPYSGSAQITGSLGLTGSLSVSGSAGTVFSSNADTLLISGSLIVTGSTIITGSLNVNGSITGSLFGTSSYAVTASYLIGSVVSASYAQTASYANATAVSGFGIGGSAIYYSTVNVSIAGSNNLFTLSTGSYTAATIQYTVFNGSNSRAGQIIASWNNGNVQYTDFSTVDNSSTAQVTMSIAIISSQMQFNAQTNTSGWTIKSQATLI